MWRTRLGAALAVVLLAGGCAPPAASGGAGPATTPVAASRQTPGEVERTLASLRRVDDLPLYEMAYHGGYDALAGVPDPAAPSPFGCSLFVASGDPVRPLFARNFDWDAHPALVLHTDPPAGYASISIVDISYLGVGSEPVGDRRLPDAPLLPFDGMNERGLLADATGASAVVEFVDGRMQVLRGGPPWQAPTNIRLAEADETARQRDWRYAALAAALGDAGGVVGARRALELLRGVAQPHTRWSVTYDLRGGAVQVVTGKWWATVHEFQLSMDPYPG